MTTGWSSSPDQASTDAPEPDAPIRVLIVDDDPRVRQAIGSTIALEADMVTVAEAADAGTALAVAEDTKPSVALVDVLLPDDVTGLALVRSLQQRPGCEVVAMSVRSGLRSAARAAGAVAFVEKGSDIDALLQAVRLAGTTS
jgi:DNA-binding NarL/FixJ family response regulator